MTFEVSINGKTFEVDAPTREAALAAIGQRQPSEPAVSHGPPNQTTYTGNEDPERDRASLARLQGDTSYGEYLSQTLGNVIPDLGRQALGVVDLAKLGINSLGDVSQGIAERITGTNPSEKKNLAQLAQVPGAIVQHYSDYLDPNKRALMVRDQPVGTVLDIAGAMGAAKGGMSAARSLAEHPKVTAAAGAVRDTAKAAAPLARDVAMSPAGRTVIGGAIGGPTGALVGYLLDRLGKAPDEGGGGAARTAYPGPEPPPGPTKPTAPPSPP